MKEFNPTKENLLMLEGLILEIKKKKNALVSSKMNFENLLSKLKANYSKATYKSREFKELKIDEQKLKDELAGIEMQIKGLNEELIYKNKLKLEVEYHIKHNKKLEGGEDLTKVINKILLLKIKYSDFTKDRTRIASLRVMASEFIDDLEKLLK